MGKQQQPKEERKDAILVDVRDENEFRSGYIHGAVSIPLGIPGRLDTAVPHRYIGRQAMNHDVSRKRIAQEIRMTCEVEMSI
jgi:rhodanese-related sulfurtransferase